MISLDELGEELTDVVEYRFARDGRGGVGGRGGPTGDDGSEGEMGDCVMSIRGTYVVVKIVGFAARGVY